MRNEQLNIGKLLEDISVQDYPRDLFKVFVIDDHSTDESVSIAGRFHTEINMQLIRLPQDKQGKKAGIGHTLSFFGKEELIITIDADCRLQPSWLSAIESYYAKYQPPMMICPVLFNEGNTFFSRWQALEWMSLMGTSAGAAGNNHPIMCSGANLAIERSVMEKYAYIYHSDVASGDDILMMMEIKRNSTGKIHFLKSQSAVVRTDPQETVKQFVHQRNRWTSKSPEYTDPDIILVALVVFLSNLVIVLGLVIGIFCPDYLYLPVTSWVLKLCVDWLFLYTLTGFWGCRRLMNIIIPAQLIYPFYIVGIGIAGNFSSSVRWKGRVSKSFPKK